MSGRGKGGKGLGKGAMSSLYPIRVLEERTRELEELILGTKRVTSPSETNISSTLMQVQQRLEHLEKTSSIFALFQQKYDRIQLLLEANDTTLTLDAKLQIVLSLENVLKETSELIDKVTNYLRFINSEQLHYVGLLKEKMKPVVRNHIEQKLLTEKYIEKFHRLISTYNDTITLLSLKFLQWDYLISSCEQAVDAKLKNTLQ